MQNLAMYDANLNTNANKKSPIFFVPPFLLYYHQSSSYPLNGIPGITFWKFVH